MGEASELLRQQGLRDDIRGEFHTKEECLLTTSENETKYSTAALRRYIARVAPPANVRIRIIRTDEGDELEG